MHGVAVMIIKDRRIEELAHQDGCCRLLRERFGIAKTRHVVRKTFGFQLARSIYNPFGIDYIPPSKRIISFLISNLFRLAKQKFLISNFSEGKNYA